MPQCEEHGGFVYKPLGDCPTRGTVSDLLESLGPLDSVIRKLRHQHVTLTLATLLQFRTKEGFVGSQITDTRSQDGPPERERGNIKIP